MLIEIRSRPKLQLLLGLGMGILFGFFLQKGQVTKYDVILGQFLLQDFTVLKVMLTAIIVGMAGIYALQRKGWAELHPKPGSLGSTVIGGLLFGSGMAFLGYCPGTNLGAVGQGSLDALLGGLPGMLAGGALYAFIYPALSRNVLGVGSFGTKTMPELFRLSIAKSIGLFWAVVLLIFVLLEMAGL